MMMEAAPSAPFIMAEPDLLLEFLIIAFDAPAQLGAVDQIMEGDVVGKGREPVFGRFLLTFGPLDQQLFLRPRRAPLLIAMRHTHAHACKT